jgi:hypothetical protein
MMYTQTFNDLEKGMFEKLSVTTDNSLKISLNKKKKIKLFRTKIGQFLLTLWI